jgi:esterase/lipase superfamily enzyme
LTINSHTYFLSNRVAGNEDSNKVGPLRYLLRQNGAQESYSPDGGGFSAVDEQAFTTQLGQDLRAARDAQGRPQLAIYVHGFDTPYAAAFPDLQSFGLGLAAAGYPGVVVGVTWPSFTHTTVFPPETYYAHAQDNAKHSKGLFEAVIRLIAGAQTQLSGLDASLLCHSMGNYLLAETVAAGDAAALKRPLRSVLMLAADVVNTLFQPGDGRGPLITALTQQVTVYYSGNDEVLEASGVINFDVRLGYGGPADYGTLAAKVAGLDCTAQVATSAVAETYVPVGQSSILASDVTVHSCYRYVPALLQDQAQAMLGLPLPHRQAVGGSGDHFTFIRFPS